MGYIILADDDDLGVATLNSVAKFFRGQGHSVVVCCDGNTVMDHSVGSRPDILVCDIGLVGRDGFQLALELHKMYPSNRAGMILTAELMAEVGGWLQLPEDLLATVDDIILRPRSSQVDHRVFHEQLVTSIGLILYQKGIPPLARCV